MYDIVRDSSFGQIVRYLTRNKYLRYVEESEDFEHPHYQVQKQNSSLAAHSNPNTEVKAENSDLTLQKSITVDATRSQSIDESDKLSKSATSDTDDLEYGTQGQFGPIERLVTQQSLHSVAKTKSQIIKPTQTADGVILVDWYMTGKFDYCI
jgi:DHA1 family multidrug resistance protein-like MFS transporter